MVSKVIEATEMRVGTFLMIDGVAWQVKKMDVSKTGKHGHAKVRFEAVSVMTNKKKVSVIPGHEKFEVPMITKRQGQVLSVSSETASLMDNESFESLEIAIPEELREEVSEGKIVEYWDVEGEKVIKRLI